MLGDEEEEGFVAYFVQFICSIANRRTWEHGCRSPPCSTRAGETGLRISPTIERPRMPSSPTLGSRGSWTEGMEASCSARGTYRIEVRLLTLARALEMSGFSPASPANGTMPTEDFSEARAREGWEPFARSMHVLTSIIESLNFLVQKPRHGVRTERCPRTFGVSMAEAARIMRQAGMQADATGYWNRDTVDANMGKRIGIRESADPLLSSYLFAAYNQNAVMEQQIAAVVSGKGQSMSRAEMRSTCTRRHRPGLMFGDTSQLRSQALRSSL